MRRSSSSLCASSGPPTGFIRKYVFSTDHKVIGIQYWCLALFSVFVGMALSLLMRLQLGWPGQEWGFLKTLFPNSVVTTEQLGRAMLNVARRGAEKRVLEIVDILAVSGAD